MNKKRAYWFSQVLGWLFYATFMILGAYIVSSNFKPIMALPIIIEAAFFFAITHIFRLFSKKWGWLQLPATRLMPKMLASIVLMAIPVYFIRVGVSYFSGNYTSSLLSGTNITGNIIGNFIVLFIWTSLYYAYHYFERYNLSLKYEVAMNRMELDRLKSQLNPHFIFNALNSIRALVDEDPQRSKQAINHLSNILRSSLSANRQELITVKEELDTVRDYLEMETIRFEERLQTNIEMAPGSGKVLIPPLMLQTLVENGIKHGISKLKEGGKLSLNTYLDSNDLVVEIRNAGQLKEKKTNGMGYGIENTKQRLNIIYHDKAGFDIMNENKNTVLTLLRLPKNIKLTKNESISN